MRLKVLKRFWDIKDQHRSYEPDEVIEITDEVRANNMIERGYCEVATDVESDDKTITFNSNSFSLKVVKDALKSIDVQVANNAGVDAVNKKLAELTDEQLVALAEILA